MKLFECQNCGQPLYFENTRCESCGLSLGYLPECETITALKPVDGLWRALAAPSGHYRYCANVEHGVCNWLIQSDNPEAFCAACRHNRMIPDLSQPGNLAHWRMIEIAKHRLFYTLLKLRLPLTTRPEDPDGLAFDFLSIRRNAVRRRPGDDRPRQRPDHDQPRGGGRLPSANASVIRWASPIARCSAISATRSPITIGAAWLRARRPWTSSGAFSATSARTTRPRSSSIMPRVRRADWPEHFVTAYASAHPWEDFAETWAHYFHMVDTLETAHAFGLTVRPRLVKAERSRRQDRLRLRITPTWIA